MKPKKYVDAPNEGQSVQTSYVMCIQERADEGQ